MPTTYARPEELAPDQHADAGPAAEFASDGRTCGATTSDDEWTCTRAPHGREDEHCAAYDVGGYGPVGSVGRAWIE